MRAMVRVVDPGLVEQFDRDGFVVVPDLLTDDELDHFGTAVDAAVAHRTRHDHRPLAERSRYEQCFRQCQNLWDDRPDVLPLTFHPTLGQAAAELLGCDAVRLWHDQALYKAVSYTHLRAHETDSYLVCRLLLEKK